MVLTPFRSLSDLVREHAGRAPQAPALDDGQQALNYGALDALMDRIAGALQRDGLQPGGVIAICAAPSVAYAALFLGAFRAGAVVAPLAPSLSLASLLSMLHDAQAQRLFLDAEVARQLAAAATAPGQLPPSITLDDSAGRRWTDWLAAAGAAPVPVEVAPEQAFNIIYSSGTTGTPKGIVQSHAMRWAHIQRSRSYGYAPSSVTLLATPLYSNTTLVSFFPAIGFGGAVHLLPKFNALAYLQTAERIRATHSMLVPVQYQRIMALPSFNDFDLSSFQAKFCTSAPFAAALKADVLARWPGGLIEFYGMTEGGGTCILEAHAHPDKLHSVGRPAPGSDIRLIDEQGRELATDAPDAVGEIVGRSPSMMNGYHRLPEKTREVEWFSAAGERYIRSGDVGRFDEDGFLLLLDRRKDVIISGGFNIYPSDIEGELRMHADVAEVAVVGVPSVQWGETPVAFVVRRAGASVTAADLIAWSNARAGKTQRLADLRFVAHLPRSEIGKVLKRELRDSWLAQHERTSATSAAAAWHELSGEYRLSPGRWPSIAGQRPVLGAGRLGRLLQGQQGEPLGRSLSSVFTLCAHAHRRCAELALAAAQAESGALLADQAPVFLLLETARDHLRSIALDWPQRLPQLAVGAQQLDWLRGCPLPLGSGCVPSDAPAAWRALAALRAWLESAVLQQDAALWLADMRRPQALQDWCAAEATRLLPARCLTAWQPLAARLELEMRGLEVLDADPLRQSHQLRELAQSLATEPDFAQRPAWRGACVETGPWSRLRHRQAGARLAVSAWTRLSARWLELIELANAAPPVDGSSAAPWLSSGALGLGQRQGLAWCEMARGLLLHWVQVDANGGVQDYRVLAPTEWNFHPDGSLAQALAALAPDDSAAARTLAAAFDPCVSCTA